MRENLCTLERGLVGCHGEYWPEPWGKNCTSHASWSGGTADLEREARKCPDGTVVIDKREAIEARGPGIVLRAPMLRPGLEERDAFRRKLADPSVNWFAGALASASGEFAGLLAGAAVGRVNLDYAGLPEYVKYWRENGARIGRVLSGRIEWEAE